MSGGKDEPYKCLGCAAEYPTNPDWDADDCPKCGEKVCPVRIWKRPRKTTP